MSFNLPQSVFMDHNYIHSTFLLLLIVSLSISCATSSISLPSSFTISSIDCIIISSSSSSSHQHHHHQFYLLHHLFNSHHQQYHQYHHHHHHDCHWCLESCHPCNQHHSPDSSLTISSIDYVIISSLSALASSVLFFMSSWSAFLLTIGRWRQDLLSPLCY